MGMTGTSWGTSSERELEQLAAEPARPLFPLLDHADAMIPFVVVLAFLPALYAVANRTLTEPGACLGLAGLKCLASRRSSGFVRPSFVVSPGESNLEQSLRPGRPFRFEHPLMIWLTALAMKVFGIGNIAGLVAAAYLCTAGLLIASYILAKRLGGERLGLITVLLLAFNPQVLQGAQEPVPQSAANLFALLSLAGLVVHWQKSSAFVSYPLLLAGIALGVCLLAGGPVAIAVMLIVVVYVLCWKLEAWQRGRSGIVWDRSQSCCKTALRSTLVLAATAFAFGGWAVLLPASRFGVDFWSEWLAGPGTMSVAFEPEPTRASFSAAFGKINRLAVPVLSLALLGLTAIVRDLWRADEDPGKRHRGLLLVWGAVALFAWLLFSRPGPGNFPMLEVWETLLTIPLVIAAALGLIEIAERRIGFLPSLSVGILALADAALWGCLRLENAHAGSQPADSANIGGWGMAIVVSLALAAAGMALAAFAWSDEKRRPECAFRCAGVDYRDQLPVGGVRRPPDEYWRSRARRRAGWAGAVESCRPLDFCRPGDTGKAHHVATAGTARLRSGEPLAAGRDELCRIVGKRHAIVRLGRDAR